MSKVTLDNVSSGYASATLINANNDTIEEAFDNTISRDGSAPNAMEAAFDMGTYRILNVGEPVNSSDGARLRDVQNGIAGASVANLVDFTPYENISSDTVQGAIQEEVDDLAASSGSSLIGFLQAGTGATARTTQTKLRERISIADFGAIGDFDPDTGTGTDDRAAIQLALNYALTVTGGCNIIFPKGNYYLGTGFASTDAQLLLGSRSTANAVANIALEGDGGVLFPGVSGKALYVANGNNINIVDLFMIGYAGGTLGASRGNDALIYIGNASRHVKIRDCYLANCLGWQIGGGGDTLVANGGTGDTIQDLSIEGCTLKNRYGNGTDSYSGGSASAWAAAFIDIHGLRMKDNTIIGIVDLEPNINNQYIAYCDIGDNRFDGGFVTPVVPAGVATYWQDEEAGLYDVGTRIPQGVNCAGAAGSPKIRGNVTHDNTFDYGTINANVGPYLMDIINNRFELGKIVLGDTSGGNSNRFFTCKGNVARATTDGAGGFIKLAGDISYSRISGNTLENQALACVYDVASGTVGDAGGNDLGGNFSPLYTGFSVEVQNRGGNASTSNYDGGWSGNGSFSNPTVWHSGGSAPETTTSGTNTTPVVTETYICEVFINKVGKITGVSILNGDAVAGNIKLALANAAGVVLASTASTAQAGTAAYQQVAFSTAIQVNQAGKYFILAQFNNTSARFRSHILGNFGASKKTGEVYGTFTTITPPTTFTTGLGPIADLY